MKSTQPFEDKYLKHPHAQQIFEEIRYSYNAYTNDSSVTKFFLPEELVLYCRPIAAAFASLLYEPMIEPSNIYNATLYFIFLLSTISGVQIYLKNRAIHKFHAAYKIKVKQKDIDFAKENALFILTKGVKLSEAPQQVVHKLVYYLLNAKTPKQLKLKGRKFNTQKFES